MLTSLVHSAIPPVMTLLPDWLDAAKLLDALGEWALWGGAAIVFAECGILLGFLLPGDSLLFTIGMLVTTNKIDYPLWFVCTLLTVMAFVGNICGYYIGRASGPAIFRKNSRIFKAEHVEKTAAFFAKYGNRAIVLARFVPIVRTFITVMAGVGRMDQRRYFTYSGIGAVLWATGVTLLGAALGKVSFVANNLEVMLITIVLVSVLPIAIEYWRERRKNSSTAPAVAADTDDGSQLPTA